MVRDFDKFLGAGDNGGKALELSTLEFLQTTGIEFFERVAY